MHTTAVLMYHLYKKSTLYDNTGVTNFFFAILLLISKALGSYLATKDEYNDRRTQMKLTSITAFIGLIIMSPKIDNKIGSYALLIIGRVWVGIS